MLLKLILVYFLVIKILSNDDVAVTRDTESKDIMPGTAFQTDRFVEKNVESAIVVGFLIRFQQLTVGKREIYISR